ncbi:MAG: carbohydrate ABC transporter permease [Roseibium album]|uniref:Trehalose transport system permease protein SugB n=1 Tax=Roseibium album TaxID=311410 RepID=A0A0M6Z6J5_9HYPH|nr:carbohydrate ABC transporter permease [Roseibium album]MBG6142398.1 multiple sugar transport system permease protein [Labrenzia sp. EL_142]MBG6159041.1 multiple sugar transport system permease protein [Labrenzia sp. EL_162]MBG6165360.1 multiple sugar transport system permease protein [Labrenzia sp. EL_195]MBG6177412.1 multiple sugar transport system permease protein [Labrenzia sp. EL_132]MBG6197870.1 multiple sugar transport system permease protein [Labrenzia sp. EL_159]MBG6204291.1 multip
MNALRQSSPLAVTGKYLALAFYVAFALFPLYWLAKIAVTPDKLIFSEGTALIPSKFTFENFQTVLLQTDFVAYFRNSLIVSIGTAAITTVIAAAAGYAFSRFDFRGKRLIIALMLITQMFPLLMIIAPIYKIVAALGLLNSLTSLIIVYTAFNIPFATFLMQSFFDGIPKDLEDAGMIDGCTRFEALRKIVLPLTLPGLGATLGFIFTAAWSELLFALMLINSNDAMTFPVGLLTFVSKFSVDWGQMMAAGVLALVPSCLFFIFIQRYLVQGLTTGAVKG